MSPDWSALPTISDIPKLLGNDFDYVRFRSVCTSWRSAAPKRPQYPWLLTLAKDSPSIKLYSLPNADPYDHRLPDHIPQHTTICGSSRGWIVLNNTPTISLYNPITGAHIPLPDIRDPVVKVVLSSDPFDEQCVVMALSGGTLTHCRLGDADPIWIPLSSVSQEKSFLDMCFEGPPWTGGIDFIEDIVFYDGCFYGVSRYRMYVYDIGTDLNVREISSLRWLEGDRDDYQINYLVVSSGDLLLVKTTLFNLWEVFQVDLDGANTRLVKLETLGDRSLFVGRQSMSISAVNTHQGGGSCLYVICGNFRNEKFEYVMLIIKKERKTFENPKRYDCSGAFWFTPSLGY